MENRYCKIKKLNAGAAVVILRQGLLLEGYETDVERTHVKLTTI
jgi:hypothetical protein